MALDNKKKKELRKIANELKPMFNLGKNNLTPTFIETVDKYLEAHEIVKIKSSIVTDTSSNKVFADELAKETNSDVVETKGFTFTLFRKKN